MYFPVSIDSTLLQYRNHISTKLLAVTTSAFLGVLVVRCIRSRSTKSNITSVSGAIPLLGNAWQMMRDPADFIQRCGLEYGPVFRIQIPINREVYVVTADLVPEILKLPTSVASFERGFEDVYPINQVIYRDSEPKYKLDELPERPAGVTIINKNLRANKIEAIMDRVVHVIDDTLHKELNLRPGEAKLVDFRDLFPRLQCDISARCLLGTSYIDAKKMSDIFYNMDKEFWTCMRIYPVLPQWLATVITKHVLSLQTNMEAAMNQLIPVLKGLRSGDISIDEPTYLKFFLDHPLSDGSRRSVEDAGLQIMRGLVGTIKLRVYSLSYALHELASQPELVKELRNEILQLKECTPANINSIPLLDSFVREVLRFNSNPIMHYRYAQTDIVLSTGHIIPKGSIFAGGFGSKQGEPSPTHCQTPLDQFDPYRYIHTNGEHQWDSINVNQPGYYGFGYGTYPCRGRYFGIQELKCILKEVIINYNIRTKSGKRASNSIVMGLVIFPPTEPLIFERI